MRIRPYRRGVRSDRLTAWTAGVDALELRVSLLLATLPGLIAIKARIGG